MTSPKESAAMTIHKAAMEMIADHMTSENHHPGYVLVPTAAFEKMRAAIAACQKFTAGDPSGRDASSDERSDISFDQAMEMGATVLKLHERGLELVNIPERADEWTRNAQDYRSVCYVSAPVLAVKLRDALSDLKKFTAGDPRGKARENPSLDAARREANSVIRWLEGRANWADASPAASGIAAGLRNAARVLRALSPPVEGIKHHDP